MAKRSFEIDASNFEAVKAYILRQFTQRSWWPAEGPEQAKEQFKTMQSDPQRFAQWCETWLDSGQWRQLKKALRS